MWNVKTRVIPVIIIIIIISFIIGNCSVTSASK
jgi:hypothetical protein